MKTTTITREYDDAGRCVKETVVEYEHSEPRCSCTPNAYGYYCPLHGYRQPTGGIYPTRTTSTSGHVTIIPATKTFTVN